MPICFDKVDSEKYKEVFALKESIETYEIDILLGYHLVGKSVILTSSTIAPLSSASFA